MHCFWKNLILMISGPKNTCYIPHWLVCFKLMDSDVHDVTTALVQRYIEAAQRLTRGRFQIRQNYKGEWRQNRKLQSKSMLRSNFRKKIFLPIQKRWLSKVPINIKLLFLFICLGFLFCFSIMIIFFFRIDFDMHYLHELLMALYWKCVEIR